MHTPVQICVTSPLPTIDSILPSFYPLMTYPPTIESIGKLLPCLPSPIYAALNIPSLEMVKVAIELQAFQMQTMMLAMIRPMLTLLSLNINTYLPKIPGLGDFTLLDLVEDNANALLAAVKQAIIDGFVWVGIPIPFDITVNIPDIDALEILQAVINSYMQTITLMIVSLVTQVTSFLRIANMVALPTLPSPAAIETAFKSAVANGVGTIAEKIAAISFAGFPPFPMLPSPLIPTFSIPAVDFAQYFNMFKNNLTIALLQPIMNFINAKLKAFMTFTFPLLCITI